MPRMLATYGAVAVLVGTSAIVGQAVFALSGRRPWSWAAPAVGLATLIVVCAIAIKLPGRDVTSVAVCAVLVIASGAWLLRRLVFSRPWRPLVVALLPVLGASLPFVAEHRVGLPGVSLNNDTAVHLLWAEALRSPAIATLHPIAAGYPLGPHSLTATVASALGARMDHALTGVLLAGMPVAALAAAGVAPRASAWRQVLIGLLASLAYLFAAYYSQGSFKETLLATFLLAFVVVVRDLARTTWRGRSWPSSLRAALPCALLAAGGVYGFSHLALGWFGAFLAVWMALELLASPSLITSRHRLRGWLSPAAAAAAGAGVVLILVLLPSFSRLHQYSQVVGTAPVGGHAAGISVSDLGNLAGPLSGYEGLGVWKSADYRFPPVDAFQKGQLTALALGALVFGVLFALRRRRYVLSAAVVACAAIYWYSDRTQSPYVTAKALAIGAPLVGLLAGWALLSGPTEARLSTGAEALRVIVGLVFAGFALYSTSLVLRASPILTPAQVSELSQVRTSVGAAPTLYLGNDDYAPWGLRTVHLGFLQPTTAPPIAVPRSQKPWAYGQPFDFDSVDPSQLDRFSYVIATNAPFASQPPPNFRLVRRLRLYQLWQRVGPTGSRTSADPGDAPGTVFDCRRRQFARLARERGVAAVMTRPVVVAASAALTPGASARVAMPIPKGDWELSLEYTSPDDLKVAAGGSTWRLPANVGRPGPYFRVGTVHSQGAARPTVVSLYEVHPSRLASPNSIAYLSNVAATSRPDTRQMVPIANACGRYVDWYRTTR